MYVGDRAISGFGTAPRHVDGIGHDKSHVVLAVILRACRVAGEFIWVAIVAEAPGG